MSAFEVAQSKGLSSELYIVGEKDNFRTSNTKIEKSLSNPKIHFTGYLDNKKLVDILRTSKALVLPSRYEGLGLPPMEALYLGTNAIISDIPVFKEIYSKLPVTFFRKDNVSDLSECLLGSYPKAYNQKIIKDVIDSTYNFEIISDKILKEILITL